MQDDQIPLLDVVSPNVPHPNRTPYKHSQSTAIWTESKARLIQRYLHYFVLVTKHGNYIDGFSGPQKVNQINSWAANLVLRSEPRWLRKFFYFEKNHDKASMLEGLRDSPPTVSSGVTDPFIEVRRGDFNTRVHEILTKDTIKDSEATFCLLDQRTFECHWRTVQVLAKHKSPGFNKIELFYFFPQGWLDRAIGGLRDHSRIEAWWGGPKWDILQRARGMQRAHLFCRRFEEELGYGYVNAWPILSRRRSGSVMYIMIHASDHKDAPRLMHQAYRETVNPHAPPEQADFGFPDPTQQE